MAERGGFEPPVPVKTHLLSRQAHSTTLAPLRIAFIREQVLIKLDALRLSTLLRAFSRYP